MRDIGGHLTYRAESEHHVVLTSDHDYVCVCMHLHRLKPELELTTDKPAAFDVTVLTVVSLSRISRLEDM
jgi:hypothetical protein